MNYPSAKKIRYPDRKLVSKLFILLALVCELNGSVVVDVTQSRDSVVFSTTGGSLDISSLTFIRTYGIGVTIVAENGYFIVGGFSQTDGYNLTSGNFSGPSVLGVGSTTISTRTGSMIGIYVRGAQLYVPAGYSSGSQIGPGSATFASKTIRSMGLNPGTYTWTWGGIGNTDSLTLNIVPEPNFVSLGVIGVIGAMLVRRRSTKTGQSIVL